MDSLPTDMRKVEDRYKEILATWAAEAERFKRLEHKWVRQCRQEIALRRSLKDEKTNLHPDLTLRLSRRLSSKDQKEAN
jgi:hypothetical protein